MYNFYRITLDIIIVPLYNAIMDTSTIYNNINLEITNANYSEVGDIWEKIAPPYPYYRLYYITKGRAELVLKNSVLQLTEGNFYLIPAFSVLKANIFSETLGHYWFHFSVNRDTSTFITTANLAPFCKATEGDKFCFEQIIKLFNDPQHKNRVKTNLAIHSLANYLFSRFLSDNEYADKDVKLKFMPVLRYIDAHLSEKISNEELSKLMFLHPTYFSNLFTKHFGLSPKQYVLQKKMTVAAATLITTSDTVEQIAYELGYESEQYFNRVFSKFTGITPGEYRRRLKNGLTD